MPHTTRDCCKSILMSAAIVDGTASLALQLRRLTEPMLRREGCSNYEPIAWEEAFDLIGRELGGLQSPNGAALYTSGRASNEAASSVSSAVR